MDPAVDMKGITMRFGKVVANDKVDFSVEKGELAIILGASGAGKTTALNILGGMDTATSGHVMVDGSDITTYGKKQLTQYRRTDIGFVFQFYNLVPNLTALENVELASQICNDSLNAEQTLWSNALKTFRHSYPEVNSNVYPLPGHWQKIRNCCFATSLPVHWTTIPESRSFNFYRIPAAGRRSRY